VTCFRSVSLVSVAAPRQRGTWLPQKTKPRKMDKRPADIKKGIFTVMKKKIVKKNQVVLSLWSCELPGFLCTFSFVLSLFPPHTCPPDIINSSEGILMVNSCVKLIFGIYLSLCLPYTHCKRYKILIFSQKILKKQQIQRLSHVTLAFQGSLVQIWGFSWSFQGFPGNFGFFSFGTLGVAAAALELAPATVAVPQSVGAFVLAP
jgi:hypothetical protein